MTVIVNTGAGTAAREGDAIRAKIRDAFAAAGTQVDVVSPDDATDLKTLARRFAGCDANPIVAAGGDGTISAVAAELVNSGKTLGVLPLGTLNHFAKDLGIPTDLTGAVRTIIDGNATAVDAAEVNGRVFINNSSLGIYPRIVSRREAQQERLARGKWPAFLWATIHALVRFPFLNLQVTIEGKRLTRKTAFLFVGNNDYAIAGFRLGGRARIDGGKLGLYLTHRTGRFGLLRLALRALFGRLEQATDFEAFSVEEVLIDTRKRRLLVATDGEVTWMETPLYYRSRPAALRVLVPRTAS